MRPSLGKITSAFHGIKISSQFSWYEISFAHIENFLVEGHIFVCLY